MATANILLVEDEPAIQELLAFNVAQCGYRAIQAQDAEAALVQINLRSPRPDLAGLDVAGYFRGGIGAPFTRRSAYARHSYHQCSPHVPMNATRYSGWNPVPTTTSRNLFHRAN